MQIASGLRGEGNGVLAGRADLDLSVDRAFLLVRDYSWRTDTELGIVCGQVVLGSLDLRQLMTPSGRHDLTR